MDRSDARWPRWQRVPAGSGRSGAETRQAGPRQAGTGQAAAAELLSQLTSSLDRYQQLLDDLRAQRIDMNTFRRRAFRAGLILRDGDAVLLDLPSGTWYRYNGVELRRLGRAFGAGEPERTAPGFPEG
ncbi:hypothetical protein [Streptomyces eurocidicus]|uniref:Uncharacterized protein n=1 Tax=Streptomyces eurocidicus TaxID=66423 RepID=A0A7W8BFR0_STREU|nr:hypothetical protein [Streptomyces eurocidicus]MBB5122490.1 hypothetical protein [Streptomyces eurocidicus]